MERTYLRKLLLGLLIPLSLIISIIIIFYLYKSWRSPASEEEETESQLTDPEIGKTGNELNDEELICFEGGEDLKISDVLDAPGEVIGKTSYGTLYRANLPRNNLVLLLRFLRPASSGAIEDVTSDVHAIGLVRNPNLVPLRAFYVGSRGEKLLVHPFYDHGNLAQFIKGGNKESRNWDVIFTITLGLVKGLAHLHTGLQKPIIHGNLKSKNVLLDQHFQPCISDYGLHLLLNPTAGQEMLEISAAQGYKAPELMKIKDVKESTDIYNLGVVLLELLTGREPINVNSVDSQEFYLPNAVRNAVLEHRIMDLYHPDIVADQTGKERRGIEDKLLKLVQLAMACCSPSPSLRPHASEVVRKVEEVGK